MTMGTLLFNHVGQGWDVYNVMVLPAHAPPVQHVECRRAFYAGAQTVLERLNALGDLSEADAMAALSDMHAEMQAFADLISKGAA